MTKTCADLWQSELDRELEKMKAWLGWQEEADTEDQEEEPTYTDLAVSEMGSWWKVELSWGGPQDYFQIYLDQNGYIDKISYHYLDWFDGEHRFLWGQELETAKRFFSRYYGIGVEE